MDAEGEFEILSTDPSAGYRCYGRNTTVEFQIPVSSHIAGQVTGVYLAMAFPLISNIVLGVERAHRQAAHLAASHLAKISPDEWVGARWWRNNPDNGSQGATSAATSVHAGSTLHIVYSSIREPTLWNIL